MYKVLLILIIFVFITGCSVSTGEEVREENDKDFYPNTQEIVKRIDKPKEVKPKEVKTRFFTNIGKVELFEYNDQGLIDIRTDLGYYIKNIENTLIIREGDKMVIMEIRDEDEVYVCPATDSRIKCYNIIPIK